MKSVSVMTAAVVMAAAGAAQAAPILVTAYGQLVQAPTAPGTTPADFAAPIENYSGISAYWIIDPDAGTKVVTPLAAPSLGESVAFQGSVIGFGATIYGMAMEPLTLGNTPAALRQTFLLDNATLGGRITDQFSASSGAYFSGGGLVQGLETDRDLGDDVFISLFQLSLIESVFAPAVPGLLDGDDFPDLGALIGSSAVRLLTLRFSHGTLTNADELRLLPQMTFNVSSLSLDYIYLDDVETPEPAAFGLFGLGLAALALRRRRKA